MEQVKRIVSMLLVLSLILTGVPAAVSADVLNPSEAVFEGSEIVFDVPDTDPEFSAAAANTSVMSRASVPAAYPIPELTGNMAQDVANIARSQVGYSGENGTIYGNWWTKFTNWGFDYTYLAWCGMFACWCANQAGAKVGMAFDYNSAKANSMWNFYKNRDQVVSFSTRPQAGDFIFYGDSSGYCSHVAVVVGFNESTGKVITVGGNQGNYDGGMVTEREVPWYKGAMWGSKYILGCGRPEYPVTSVQKPVTVPKPTPAPTPTPTPVPTPTPKPDPGIDGFIDVCEANWYYDSVVFVKECGIMSGLSEEIFGPKEQLSRAQLASILYRITDSPEVAYEKIYSDVSSGSWYSDAVIWASNAGIVSGYKDGTYGPNDVVTREQVATMMYRYAQYLALETVPKMTDISDYDDAHKVSSYAERAIQWAVGYGLISGTTDTTISPKGNTTRAECAAITERFMEAYCMY